MKTLGGLLEDRDALQFVGRGTELAELGELLQRDGAVRVVHLHGPAGIGKSALLRELARRGEAAGWTPRTIEGREVAPTRSSLAQALAGVETEPRPLLLFDTYEQISGLDGLLRREVLRGLSSQARVVFAGRRAPDPGWSQDGWEAVTRTLEVGPLAKHDALALLAARGVPAGGRDELLGIAAGSPLALQLLASTSPGDDGLLSAGDREAVIRGLVSRLTEAELDPSQRDVLTVAAIARVTTPALLADVLPDRDPAAALAWLGTRSFSEPLWGGFALHDLVRRAARAEIRHRDPEREHVLRRAIADHLYARAVAGDVMLSIDLAHLLEDPILSWGYSWLGADRLSADALRPGDVDAIEATMCGDGREVWWRLSEPLIRAAPGRVAVVRDVAGNVAGFTVTLTPRNAPPIAREHHQTAVWLGHARHTLKSDNAVLWQASVVLDPNGDPVVQAMLGMVGVLRSGLRNPRYAYLPINPDLPGALLFAEACGAHHVPELDVVTPAGTIQCHVLDHGPSGVLGMQRDAIYRETGAEPPAAEGPASGVAGPEEEAEAAERIRGAVREALRAIDRPDELARNVLATGAGTPARAASVRERLARAIDDTFGSGSEERILHAVLTHGYLDPGMTHERAADTLHVSRATYFRKLRAATQRLCDHIADSERAAGREAQPTS